MGLGSPELFGELGPDLPLAKLPFGVDMPEFVGKGRRPAGRGCTRLLQDMDYYSNACNCETIKLPDHQD